MLSVKDKGILLQIVEHCERIDSKIKNINKEAFDIDIDIKEIVCFNLFQIGELARKFSIEFLKEFSMVPWKYIVGMRDKIVHGYGTINLEIVWNTCKIDIPDLENYCKNILDN